VLLFTTPVTEFRTKEANVEISIKQQCVIEVISNLVQNDAVMFLNTSLLPMPYKDQICYH